MGSLGSLNGLSLVKRVNTVQAVLERTSWLSLVTDEDGVESGEFGRVG